MLRQTLFELFLSSLCLHCESINGKNYLCGWSFCKHRDILVKLLNLTYIKCRLCMDASDSACAVVRITDIEQLIRIICQLESGRVS